MRKAKTREKNIVEDLGGWEGEEVTEVTEVQSSSPAVTAVSWAELQMCREGLKSRGF